MKEDGPESPRQATRRAGVVHDLAQRAQTPAFDDHDPPAGALIDECVHCGFCLPSCPTYALYREEMDSPRGRIYLMKEGLQGEPMTATMVRHFDLCLGCLACAAACPSNVQYGVLLESTRQQIERRHRRDWSDRLFRSMLFTLLPYPQRLALLLPVLSLYQRLHLRRILEATGIYARLPARLRAAESLIPAAPRRATIPPFVRASGRERARSGVLLGCVQRVVFPNVNAATVRVLAAEGCAVAVPQSQGCCGALSLHAGRDEEARRFARRIIDAFEPASVDYVVVNSAGCGSAMKSYGQLLRHDPAYAERAERFSRKVRDVTELLASMEPVAPRHPLAGAIAYQDACHLSHGQGIRRQPRDLLAQIPGLAVKELPRERDMCCGSAGIYNLVEPAAASALGERKARNVVSAGAQVLVTGNPGCRLQIGVSLSRLGQSLPMAHPVELLDFSIRGVPFEVLLTPGE
jgi:glycolate oxidase iron-sulfur subunit